MYIGTQPYSGIRARHTYTATAGQTSFSGAGAENVTLTYSDELYIDVYQNGVKLSPADYTATSGTTVVLAQGASVSDIVEVIKYDAFSVADTVSAKDGGVFGGNISTSGTLAVTGTSAFTGAITVSGEQVKVAGKESIWVPAGAMYPSTTNGCSALAQVETTALRPDLKVLDFAADADDFAQFSIAFPKSWNEGTITYQPFWTVTGTNTGTVVWQLGGIAVTSDATINTAFGTLVATTALAHSGTSNDLMGSAESGAVTIAGSPSTDDVCFFQINNDTSASGQTGVVRLLGIKIFFTTDAANDA
jgi:hypothetical protein